MTWSNYLQVDANTALLQGRLVAIPIEFSVSGNGGIYAVLIETASRPVVIHGFPLQTKTEGRDMSLRTLRNASVTGGTALPQGELNHYRPAGELPFSQVLGGVTIDSFDEAGTSYGIIGEAMGAPALMTAITVLAPNEPYAIEITNRQSGNADVNALLVASQLGAPLPF